MKRWLLLVCLVSAVCLGLPSGAGAQTPTSVLEANCFTYRYSGDLIQVYGITFGVTGFPPNTQFTWTLSWEYINPPVNPDGSSSTGGGAGPATSTTDANGDWIFWVGTEGVKTIWTLTVESPYLGGTVTKTLTVTCEPTSVEQCKNGGYLGGSTIFGFGSNFFGFRSQGECVAFVQRGPGPRAGP
jgi:hypothetical protein